MPRGNKHTGIDGITVEGYKSIRESQSIAIRPLTIIAGINSSGKSSIMQPLLLLKQTIDASYDPGPLQLDGVNVSITRIEQVLSKAQARSEQAKSFTLGVSVAGRETRATYGKDRSGNLRVLEMSGYFFPDQQEPVLIHEGMTERQIERALGDYSHIVKPILSRMGGDGGLAVVRERCFLAIGVEAPRGRLGSLHFVPSVVDREISRVIHLPALRGNPRRTYRTTAVEERYPGTFDTYTAGIITAWQDSSRQDDLAQLRQDVEELGLTWKVEARQLDDTQVELLVGRLPHARGGGARDLVNIADVGFGVSQTLPVIVALLAARPGQLVYLEQPEIHLHPRAQVRFANLVARAVDRGVRIVAETHSALLVRAVQTLVAQGMLAPNDVALHWFTRDPETGYTQVSTATLDEAGSFGDWPEDFDEVQLDSEAAYLDAAAARQGPS